MSLLELLNLDDLNVETDGNGDAIATLNIGSNMLPHVTVDTYQTFNGDSFFAMEDDDWIERGFERGEIDVRITDRDAILRGLGNAMLVAMSDQLLPWVPNPGDRNIVTPGELTSVRSPRFYNFETDSFAADYAVNVTALDEWLTDFGFDGTAVEAWGRRQWASRDGFFSFIPGRLDGGDLRTETLLWLGVYLYFEQTLDVDELMFAGAEAAGDVYMNNTEATAAHGVYTERLDRAICAMTGRDSDDFTFAEMNEWARVAGVDLYGTTPEPHDLLERIDADAAAIVAANGLAA